MNGQKNGFFLLDALIAMLLLSLLLPALALLFRQAGLAAAQAGNRTIALQLAQREQESLKTPSQLRALCGNDRRSLSIGGQEFTVVREKRPFMEDGMADGLFQVDVCVEWREPLQQSDGCRVKIAALHRQD